MKGRRAPSMARQGESIRRLQQMMRKSKVTMGTGSAAQRRAQKLKQKQEDEPRTKGGSRPLGRRASEAAARQRRSVKATFSGFLRLSGAPPAVLTRGNTPKTKGPATFTDQHIIKGKNVHTDLTYDERYNQRMQLDPEQNVDRPEWK